MKKIVVIFVVVVLVVGVASAWQAGSAYLANVEFHDDIKDIAAQGNVQAGLADPRTTDQLRSDVVSKALSHGIEISPERVTIERTPDAVAGRPPKVYIKVEYDQEIKLAGYPFVLHFSPESGSR